MMSLKFKGLNNIITVLMVLLLIYFCLFLIRCSQDSVDSLIKKLNDKNPNVRANAADKLGTAGDPRAVEPLIEALKDEDLNVKMAVIQALEMLKDTRAVDPLIATMMSKSESTRGSVQHYCAYVLEGFGKPAIEKLRPFLKDERLWVRGRVTHLLGHMGKDAVELLTIALKDQHPGIRREAARALGWIKDSRTIEPLIGALKDENSDVRSYAAETLGKIGEPAVLPLLAALKDEDLEVRKRAAWALGEIEDPRAVRFLTASLRDKDLEIVAGAHSFFIRTGGAGTEPVLIEALNKYGDKAMAGNFLNCGNLQLKEAATKWAKSYGIRISSVRVRARIDGPRWRNQGE